MLATPNHRRLTTLLAGAVAIALSLSACASGSTSSSTSTRATDHQSASSPCSLLTAAQIKQTLGKTVDPPRIVNSTRLTVCTYPSKTLADTVIVGFRAKVTEADAGLEQARLEKLHGSLTDVSGQGFSAYYFSDTSVRPTVLGLVTINGQTQVTVASTAPLAQQEALTQQIFATLLQATHASTSTTTSTAVAP